MVTKNANPLSFLFSDQPRTKIINICKTSKKGVGKEYTTRISNMNHR